MNRLFNNLLGKKEEQPCRGTVPSNPPSTFISESDKAKANQPISSPKMQGESLEALEAEQRSIQKQVLILKEQLTKMETALASLNMRIQRYKVSQSACQKQFSEEKVKLNITEEPLDSVSDNDDEVTGVPPIVLPKPLKIKGYEKVEDFIWRHVNDILTELRDPYYYRGIVNKIAISLSIIGKEIIFEKTECNKNEEQLKEWREIIATCNKIVSYKNNNDEQGYKKMVNFFYQRYPKPQSPFGLSQPTDFFAQSSSIYSDAFYLMFFMFSFKNELFKYNKQFWSDRDKVLSVDEIGINDILIDFMKMFYMLRLLGYSLAVVPIFDENIIYRPRRVAQDGHYFSLYYYDNYVEEPQMVTENEIKPVTPTYYASGGSTYVNGHYRSGYWRNGRWVSGGYVKGHYRS